MVFILMGLSGVLFLGGVLFLLRGFASPAKDDLHVVPISDLKAIKDLETVKTVHEKNEPVPPDIAMKLFKADAPAFLKEKQDEPIGTVTADPAPAPAIEAPPPSREPELIEENQKLSARNNELEKRLQKFMMANQELEDQKKNFSQLQEGVAKLENDLTQVRNQDNLKIKLLEEEIQALKKAQAQDIINKLNIENQNLIAQLKIREESIRHFKEIAASIKSNYEEKLAEANKIINQFNEEKKEWANPPPPKEQPANALQAIADELMNEQQFLLKAKAQVEEECRNLRATIAHLEEKEKFLQYELTKTRAQAVGLEKLCEDFKVQIDEMAKVSGGT